MREEKKLGKKATQQQPSFHVIQAPSKKFSGRASLKVGCRKITTKKKRGEGKDREYIKPQTPLKQ